VHSERSPAAERKAGARVHGMQRWVALPRADEEAEPAFQHHAAESIPVVEQGEARLRVLAGEAYGARSPVKTFSPTFYVDAALPAGAELRVPDEYAERAAYVVEGAIACGAEHAEPGRMLVFVPGAEVDLRATRAARLVLVGGAPIDGERHIWWNFVSSSQDRIEQAKRDWRERRFDTVPGDEVERIPLPE
jgi:redox-sensitive bicupin YhaK (pirin superfamily)